MSGAPKTETLVEKRLPFANLQLFAIIAVVVMAGLYAVSRTFAATASLTLVPSTTSVNIGDMVTVQIRENSSTDPINVVQANVAYDATKLQFVSFDETGSAFPTVVTITQTAGTVQAARGTNGGTSVTGDQLVTKLNFKALTAGSVPLTIAAGSAVVRTADTVDILAVKNNTSVTVADLSAPTVPVGLTSSAVGITSATVNWTASTDNVGVAGYRVYRGGTQVGTVSAAGATSFADSALSPATTYSYTVSSYDAVGNVSSQSLPLSVTTLADTIAPTAPGKPTSSTQTMTSISLAWTAATDNIAVTGYRVYRNSTLVASPTALTYTDTGLSINTTYSYTIAAVDAAGNLAPQSAATSVKTLADTSAPTVPGTLGATVTNQSVALAWTASTDNVGVVGYTIYQDTVQLATGVTTTTYTVSNVAAGAHTYAVLAYDAAGNTSAQTAGVVATVYAQGDINKDGRVDVFDLSNLLSNWAKTGAIGADLNGDSVVNIFDLSILLNHWTG